MQQEWPDVSYHTAGDLFRCYGRSGYGTTANFNFLADGANSALQMSAHPPQFCLAALNLY